MKKLVASIVLLLCGLVSVAHAQTTSITASILKISGVAIPTGNIYITGVDQNGNAIPFVQGGGGLNGPYAIQCSIVAGAITPACNVPDSTYTTPAHILYNIQVVDTSTGSVSSGRQFTLSTIPNITGATWALDAYAPTAATTTAQMLQVSYGTAPAPIPCINATIYIRNYGGGQEYICVNGLPVAVSSSSSSVVYGTTAGTAAQGNDSRIVGAEQTANKGMANGYAALDSFGLVPTAQLGTGTPSATTVLSGARSYIAIAPVATSGAYSSLSGLPTLGTAAAQPTTAFDAAGAAAAAQAAAIAADTASALQKTNNLSDVANTATARANLGAAAAVTNPVTAGLVQELPFLDGTGTTVTDISGAGHNATFCSGANAPTWMIYGVSILNGAMANNAFQCVNSGLTTFKTVVIATCANPLPVTSGTGLIGYPANQYPTLWGPSASGTGGVLWLGSQNLTQTGGVAFFGSTFQSGGAVATTTAQAFGGCHVFALALDTTDRVYVDGVEDPYVSTGSTAAAATTTGTYLYGDAFTGTTEGWAGSIQYATVYSSVLSPAQVYLVSHYVQQKVASRLSLPIYPVSVPSRNAYSVIGVGDSLTAGFTGTAVWLAAPYVSTANSYTFLNYGLSSMLAQDNDLLSTERWGQNVVPGTKVFLWNGTNDMCSNSRTALDAYYSNASEVQKIKALGGIPILATMISRGSCDANKNALNLLLRQHAQELGAWIVDLGAIASIGADGASATTACFNSDQTHLTGPAASSGTCGSVTNGGYGLVAQTVGNILNLIDGSTSANPQALTATGNIGFNLYTTVNCATACTVTLPDGNGMQGNKPFVIANIGTATVTVATTGSQTINGITSIAAGASGTFTPLLTGPTTGGVYWTGR